MAADFAHGQVTLTTAGTAVQLLPSTYVQDSDEITIRALTANTGVVYLGKVGVTSSTGYQLAAGGEITFRVENAPLIYAVGTVNGDKVSYLVAERA